MKKNTCALRVFCFMLLISFGVPVTGNAAGQIAAWGRNTYGQITSPSNVRVVKAVAAGDAHSLALLSDGTVAAWGGNDMGQTNVPVGLRNVVAIAAKRNFNLGLRADGTVMAWGQNSAGQTNVPTNLVDVVAIATGGNHVLALRSGGSVAAWGSNNDGQSTVPSGLSNVISVAAGAAHSLVLKAGGNVVGWGRDSHDLTNFPPNLSNIVAIAAGHEHSLALRDDGTVVAWGDNTYGQLNVPSGLSNVVKIVAGSFHSLALKADGTLIVWGFVYPDAPALPPGLMNVTDMAGGNAHSLAIVFGGSVQIVEEPQSQNIAYGSNVTFSVVATGAESLTYQWLRNGTALTDNSRYNGRTNATLTITNAQFDDAGTYRVVVSNAFGSVGSTGAILTVISPPFIISQSENRTVGAGTGVSLSVSASGTPPLSYQWSLNGTNLPGRTSSSLFISDVQTEHAGVYSLMVSNVYGTASTNITLAVTNTAPFFSQQPFITTTNLRTTIISPFPEGTSVVLNVSAKGSRPLAYQLRFNGANIPGATNSTLLLSHLTYDDAGYYSVEVSNAFGSTNSAKLLLDVSQLLVMGTPFAGNTNIPLGLSGLTTVAAGGSHIMALRSDGTVRVWMANPNFIFGTPFSVTNVPATATNVMAIAAGRDHCMVLRSNGTVVAWGGNNPSQTNVPLGLSNVVGIAAGNFRSFAVKADGKVIGWGSQSQIPSDLSNVVAVAAGPSQNLALKQDGTVTAWGSSPLASVPPGLSNVIAIAAGSQQNIALRSNGTVVTWISSSGFSTVLDGKNVLSNAVAISAGSNVRMILKQDGTASTAGFEASNISTITNVSAVSAGGIASGFGVVMFGNGSPVITLQPSSQSVSRSNIVQLHARAVGIQPMSYQWQLDKENIPGATNASLLITNVQGEHAGGYRMIASNTLGSTFSATAHLTIPFNTNLAAALNATNLIWESSSSTSKTVNVWFAQIRETHDGDAAAQSGGISHNQQTQLSTTVTGPGTLTFWWKVSSEAGYDHLRFQMDNQGIPLAMISGEIGWEKKTFSILPGQHVLRWTYSKDGTVSSGRDAGWVDEVVFTQPVPTIIRHPFDITVSAGAKVTIPAFAESASPMTYQWLKNGTNLFGATSQYLTLTNVTLNDAGTYAIKVSNTYGSVTSSNAVLTVRIPWEVDSLQFLSDGSALLSSRGSLSLENPDAFEVQASTNVKDWITLPITPVLTNGLMMFHDTNSKDFPMRFYRIVEH